MKKFLRVLLILSCIFLCSQRIKADKQWLQNIDFFINKTIHDHEDCFEWKTFIKYDLLWVSINNDGNFEYYVNANGQWYFVDERWNLNSSCKFLSRPIAIELAETKTWYALINYQNPKNSLKNETEVKKVFSDNAYKNRKARENWITDLNALYDAEEYFWVKLDEVWNFDCKFCDTIRYFVENFQNKSWDYRNLYINEPIGNKRFKFNSDWTMQRMWGKDWTYSWHFWKNDTTIMIKAPNNTWSIERLIIDELNDNEMVLFTESIQI